MTTKLSPEIITLLRKTIAEPCLANSRELEICLNHDKALRIAISEREKDRGVKFETV